MERSRHVCVSIRSTKMTGRRNELCRTTIPETEAGAIRKICAFQRFWPEWLSFCAAMPASAKARVKAATKSAEFIGVRRAG
jgi:hypothetical protein